MNKKLAIIGASIVQKPLYQKAKEMRLETHGFAWDKGEDSLCKEFADYYYPISIVEKEQILEKCKEIGIFGVTSIANDSCVPIVSYVAEKMGLPGNSFEDSLVSTDKYLMRQAFLKNGVNSPRFAIADENMNLTGFTFPLIVKPTDRAGSTGVMKVEKEEDLKNAIEQAKKLSFAGKAIVEEYVSGNEATVDMISWQGKHYPIAISDTETLGGPYYSKIGYHQPTRFSNDIRDKIITEAKKAITSLNIKYGASDIEVKVTDGGEVKIIEVNPRMGGDSTETLVRLSTGYDFVKGVINVAMNQFEEPVLALNKYSGVCFLSKETEYLKPVMENKENDPDIITVDIFDNELHYLQGIAGRSGYFIYQSAQRRDWRKK